MYKELIRNKCIDISRLLLLRAKELQINDNECHILMLVYTLKDIGIQTVTPQMIQNYSMLSNQELNKVLASLLNKNLIYNRLGSISLNNLEQKLLQENNKTEEVETEVNLISIFEEQFARALSPIELNIIKDWKNCEYSDEMIIKALKEAVKSQVLNFRYIEGILSNWAKNGIKQRYIEQEEPKRTVPISEYKWWENE
ncbi:DNA replication protein DnaD [Thomasclavelia cocleata]|uniref:DNA replication protein n=1 Tax=Thomasclavelia cocleata TaxID=69824 RepID=A0A1I0FGF2_9FIRM|nr:DnaD domain protein [Thomasclavelia cocleata]MCR1961418.1 DnaD domain protein [Thomasclavelia cocleata]NDO41241.1 DnaD domain protein [Thomasclavelia cocleata]PJN80591.1 DNA replication protein DnaD [Thomasclavelia cocleata]SET57097.1 DNA replication protein [Thomasclavelia cocleata]